MNFGSPVESRITPWDALSSPVPGLTQPGQSIGAYLQTLDAASTDPRFARLTELLSVRERHP